MNPNEMDVVQPEENGLDVLLEEHPELLDELEQRVQQAVEAARAEWRKAEEEKIAQVKAEAEKSALLSPEEKAVRAEQEKAEELARREQDVTRREMRLSFMEKLTQRRLPMALLDALCYEDPEKCEESLNRVESAFRAAVQQAVNSRMQGKTPENCGSRPDYSVISDEDYYKMTWMQGEKE